LQKRGLRAAQREHLEGLRVIEIGHDAFARARQPWVVSKQRAKGEEDVAPIHERPQQPTVSGVTADSEPVSVSLRRVAGGKHDVEL
jgi:hypothetical protein